MSAQIKCSGSTFRQMAPDGLAAKRQSDTGRKRAAVPRPQSGDVGTRGLVAESSARKRRLKPRRQRGHPRVGAGGRRALGHESARPGTPVRGAPQRGRASRREEGEATAEGHPEPPGPRLRTRVTQRLARPRWPLPTYSVGAQRWGSVFVPRTGLVTLEITCDMLWGIKRTRLRHSAVIS